MPRDRFRLTDEDQGTSVELADDDAAWAHLLVLSNAC
jgi:hypothetical protein